MHKKVVALLSAGILLFSLGACGSPSVAKDGKDTAAVDDEHAFTFSCVSYDASGRKGARVSFTSYKDGWDKTGTTYDCTADEQVGEPSRKVMDALKTVHVKDDGADTGLDAPTRNAPAQPRTPSTGERTVTAIQRRQRILITATPSSALSRRRTDIRCSSSAPTIPKRTRSKPTPTRRSPPGAPWTGRRHNNHAWVCPVRLRIIRGKPISEQHKSILFDEVPNLNSWTCLVTPFPYHNHPQRIRRTPYR